MLKQDFEIGNKHMTFLLHQFQTGISYVPGLSKAWFSSVRHHGRHRVTTTWGPPPRDSTAMGLDSVPATLPWEEHQAE